MTTITPGLARRHAGAAYRAPNTVGVMILLVVAFALMATAVALLWSVGQ